MSQQVVFNGVYPIGDTDIKALPVKELGPAIGYYTQVLGFSLVSREEDRAVLRRDEAEIGLAVNGGDPEQASCYFAVSDVEQLREELAARGIEPSPVRRRTTAHTSWPSTSWGTPTAAASTTSGCSWRPSSTSTQ